MEKKKRPALRGGKGTLTDKSTVENPQCRNHGTEMKFDPLLMGWRCPVADCSYRRYRKVEVDQYGPPLVCEGPYTLTLVHSNSTPRAHPRFILRGSNNVALDVSDLVKDYQFEPGAATANFSSVRAHSRRLLVTLDFATFSFLVNDDE